MLCFASGLSNLDNAVKVSGDGTKAQIILQVPVDAIPEILRLNEVFFVAFSDYPIVDLREGGEDDGKGKPTGSTWRKTY